MIDTSKVTVEGTKLKFKKLSTVSVKDNTLVILFSCLKEKK